MTGYTSTIKDDTTLAGFALTCARAFGALLPMRDDPMDAPIREFKPSDYYFERTKEAREEVRNANMMTLDDAALGVAAHNANILHCARRCNREESGMRARYEAMLAKVNAWQPPTPDHVGLKEFMAKQIMESIQWDCQPAGFAELCYPLFSGTAREWREKVLAKAVKELADAEKSLSEEVERCAKRNGWVEALRKSLV